MTKPLVSTLTEYISPEALELIEHLKDPSLPSGYKHTTIDSKTYRRKDGVTLWRAVMKYNDVTYYGPVCKNPAVSLFACWSEVEAAKAQRYRRFRLTHSDKNKINDWLMVFDPNPTVDNAKHPERLKHSQRYNVAAAMKKLDEKIEEEKKSSVVPSYLWTPKRKAALEAAIEKATVQSNRFKLHG